MDGRVTVKVEAARGCGYRKAGGLYLMSGGLSAPCGKLPIPLTVCPTCGAGIHPSRGWTWVNGRILIEGQDCALGPHCKENCPLRTAPEKVGLLWVGEKFYPTPTEFTKEANLMGVSRRIPAVPKGFKLGETWVWLAHRKVIPVFQEVRFTSGTGTEIKYTPGVFRVFQPVRIERVLSEQEMDDTEFLDQLEARGITPVKVVRDVDAQVEMPLSA